MGSALSVRTRTQSIFTHNPFYGPHANRSLLVGIFGSICFSLLFTQVSFFHNQFLTAPVPIKYGLIAVVWAVGLLMMDEGRKYGVRNYPESFIAKVAW
jgi:sodium/potassium-transporting ATPase subunit alpha